MANRRQPKPTPDTRVEVRKGKPHSKGFLDFKKRRNDIRYYLPEGAMSKDIASLPFGQLEGARFTFNGGASAVTSTAPTVAIVYFHSMVDSAYSATNGVTQSARTFYTWVRHQNAGHTNYDAPDLGMYLLATNECVKIATYCKRIYKLINTYRLDSRVLPVQIFEALGINNTTLNSMINELPSFKGRVNYFIRRLSQFAFPSDVPLYSAQKFLIDDCFIDSLSIRRQYYWFEPYSWLQFDATTWPTGSALSRKSFRFGTYTSLLTMMDDFDKYLDALLSDEDINIMSGDILKAYRANNLESNLFQFEELDGLATLEFKDDPNVLKRIHNASICGGELSFGDIVQSSTGVIHALLGGQSVVSASGIVIDSTTGVQTTPIDDAFKSTVTDNYLSNWCAASLVSYTQMILKEAIYDDDEIPSSDDIVERTRFMVLSSGISSGTQLPGSGPVYYYSDLTHGTEIIHSIVFYDRDSAGRYYMSNNNNATTSAFMQSLAGYKHFPRCYPITSAALPNYPAVGQAYVMWYDCYTVIPFTQLQLINQIVLFHELGVQSAVRMISKK